MLQKTEIELKSKIKNRVITGIMIGLFGLAIFLGGFGVFKINKETYQLSSKLSPNAKLKLANEGELLTAKDVFVSTLEFDDVYAEDPDIIPIAGNIYAIAYGSLISHGVLKTIEINPTGRINQQNAIIDTLDFASPGGRNPNMISIHDDFYAIVYTGTSNNGFLTTVRISPDGQITDDIISIIKFDSDRGLDPRIIHIAGEFYAIAYTGPNDLGVIKTIEISSQGEIGEIIDTLSFTYVSAEKIEIIPVVGNIYALAFRDFDSYGSLKTVEIEPNGQISDEVIDSSVFASFPIGHPKIVPIFDEFYAVAFGKQGYEQGYIKTLKIELSGEIVDYIFDSLEFDSAYHLDLIPISSNIFALVHQGGSDTKGYLKTMEIGLDGLINNIDNILVDREYLVCPEIIRISDNIYAIAYQGGNINSNSYFSGYLKTVKIKRNGNFGSGQKLELP